MKRKVVTYVRVSTEEQAKQGYSIPAQHQILQDYAKGHDLEIVRAFEESQSAFKPGRIQFKEMLAFLKKNKDVKGVLCYKIDRIARNLRDYSELAEMAGVRIISATEALPENPTGTLIGTVQAGFSRYFSEQLSERVQLGMQTKAKEGVWPSFAPIGYLNDQGSGGIVVDAERSGIIQKLFEIYAYEDVSLSHLVQWARERGLRTRKGGTLTKGAIHKLLRNPIYYGALRWKGVIYEGSHQQLISKALFDKVQDRLSGRSYSRTKHIFPYRGLLQCGYCGCNITASLEKKRYIYYHCTQGRGKCLQPYVRQDIMGDRLKAVVDNIHLTEDQISVLLDMMRRGKSRRQEQVEKRIQSLKNEAGIRSKRRDALYFDKLDGKITEERWQQLEGELTVSLDKIRGQIELLESIQEPQEESVQATFELLERAPVLYSKQKDEERARLLRTLVSNCIVKGDSIDPVYKKPFDLVAIGTKTGNWYARRDSNPQPPVPKTGALSS